MLKKNGLNKDIFKSLRNDQAIEEPKLPSQSFEKLNEVRSRLSNIKQQFVEDIQADVKDLKSKFKLK